MLGCNALQVGERVGLQLAICPHQPRGRCTKVCQRDVQRDDGHKEWPAPSDFHLEGVPTAGPAQACTHSTHALELAPLTCCPCADASSYASCKSVVDCRQPIQPTGGSFSPGPGVGLGYGGIQRAYDGQTRTRYYFGGVAEGVITSSGSAPYITLNLDAAYADIVGG